MARFINSLNKGLELGYGAASSKNETAYQKYVREHYGPDVTSHRDPIALARAAAGTVGSAIGGAVRTGAGFLGHAGAGLVGAPQGPSRTAPGAVNTGGGIGSDAGAVSGITPSNRLYGNSAMTSGLSSGNMSGSGYGDTNSIGSRISGDLQRDFGLTDSQARGIVGNLGHESGGFRHYQELNPTSGRGGAGWAQWTGSRRRDFENYAKQNNLHPQSYEANYGFLKKELTGEYAGALAAVKKANTVQDAVYAFEAKFEKAGIKNYASRIQYANNLGASNAPSNTQVADLQRTLNSAGANIAVDGVMGPQTRAAMAKYPDTALAYTSTGATTTPALQAAAAQAAGTSGQGGRLNYDPKVAETQRDLNARGAKLEVDGLRGPLTRAAEQQYYGAPTSVRTGGFTNRPTYTSDQQDEGQVPRAGVNIPQTPSYTNPYTPTTSKPTPQTPSYMNPYTNSTGGAINSNIRPVPTTSVQGAVRSKSPLPGYYDSETGAGMTTQGGRAVPVRTGYAPPTGPVLAGGFSPPAQVAVPQTPAFMNPYTMSTGGANTIVAPTTRLPRARPDYAPPQQAPQQAVPTNTGLSLEALQAMAEKYGIPITRVAEVAGNIGSQAREAFSQGSRSGMGYSGGSYSGGSYGGAGGRSISQGVGGAYRNR